MSIPWYSLVRRHVKYLLLYSLFWVWFCLLIQVVIWTTDSSLWMQKITITQVNFSVLSGFFFGILLCPGAFYNLTSCDSIVFYTYWCVRQTFLFLFLKSRNNYVEFCSYFGIGCITNKHRRNWNFHILHSFID